MKGHVHISKQTTNRSSGHLDLFLSDISKKELLSSEEEFVLCEKIRAGDTAATQELIERNLRFVVSVAKQYQHRGIPLPDLINEGSIGLIKAAQRFDSTRGFKFISYAVRWIVQCIKEAIYRDAKIIRLPHNQANAIYNILSMTSKLEQQLQRLPTKQELAAALEIDISELQYIQQLANTSLYLLDDFTDGQETSSYIENFNLGDENTTEHYIQQEATVQTVTQLLSLLPTDIQTICKMKYGIAPYTYEHTYDEIAVKFDTTALRIKYLIKRSLSYLYRRKTDHNIPTIYPHTPRSHNKQNKMEDAMPDEIKHEAENIMETTLDLDSVLTEDQRANIVQMTYSFPPYTHTYTTEEIAHTLQIPVSLVTDVLENTTQNILSNPDITPSVRQLIATFKPKDQPILEMKYGFGSYAHSHYTDIEIADQVHVREFHVKYIINAFEHKLRTLIFAPQLSAE